MAIIDSNLPNKVAFVLCVCLLTPASDSSGQDEDEDDGKYRSPRYQSLPFPKGGEAVLAEEDVDLLISALLRIARNSRDELRPADKAKAVALARSADPLHKAAFVTDYQLARGVDPGIFSRVDEDGNELPRGDESSYETLATFAERLSESPRPEAKVYASYLEAFLDEVREGFSEEEVSWDAILSKPVDEEEPDTELPASIATGLPPDTRADDSNKRKVGGHEIAFLSTDGVLTIRSLAKQGGDDPFRFGADERLGSSYFGSGFREGVKFLALGNGGSILGWKVEFETDADEEKDREFFTENGPAATLGCLLSLRALMKGQSFDEGGVAFAADVNADGTVQPVRDIRDRLVEIGATDVELLGIAKADATRAYDLLLLKGPTIFSKHQIFSLERIEDAAVLALAPKDRPANLQSAIAKFREIQEVLNKPDGMKFLTNSHVIKRLHEVLELAPNHFSAKALAERGLNRSPQKLSVGASYEITVAPLEPLFDDINSGEFLENPGSLDVVAFEELKRFQERLDPKLIKFSRAVVNYYNAGRVGTDKSAARRTTARQLFDELLAVRRNPEVREEMF